ncbi:MAG TPA: metallophosphoesterase family protein [Meiothermus sp.]|nr:metallophosphoesterase family protein [Meiothermus sp.]
MRYLLLADIHGNWPAMEAVLQTAPKYDRVIFLGDAVGYYPDADRVLSWLRSEGAIGVVGNHDAWLMHLDDIDPEEQKGPVFEILRWQSERLSLENRAYLGSLPWTQEVDGALLVHGSACDPLQYVDDLDTARQHFGCTSARWTLHGHTHLAGTFLALEGPNGQWVRYQRQVHGTELLLAPRARALVNPGSVGQPRDRMPGAAYGVWDSDDDSVQFFRVEFDLERVLKRILDEGFPVWLYERLLVGR